MSKSSTKTINEDAGSIGLIDRFRSYAEILIARLLKERGYKDKRIYAWLAKLNDLESELGGLSSRLSVMSDLLGRLRGVKGGFDISGDKPGFDGSRGKFGTAGEFGDAGAALNGFLDQIDRLQNLIDSFDAADDNLKQGRPDDVTGPHGLTSTPFMNDSGSGWIHTLRDVDKDGHEFETRMTVYDDGRLETRTTTQNFDGRGGTRTETFDGDNSSIREYDRQGRATRKEDSSLSATLTEISRGSEHPHDDHEGGDPSPSPNDEGTGSDTGDSANLARRLERLLERSKSISGMLRSYLGGTAHPQWDGQVDPNTGLGPLGGCK